MKSLQVTHTVTAAAGFLAAALAAQAAMFTFTAQSAGDFAAASPAPPAGPNPVPVTINHTLVSATPFAFDTMLASQDVDFAPTMASPPGPPVINNGQFTFTAAGGHVLQGTYGGILFPPNPADLSLMLGPCTFVFTGGTGMFAGASGGGDLLATISFTDPLMSGTSVIDWAGNVMLVPEPLGTAGLAGLGLFGFAVWRRCRW